MPVVPPDDEQPALTILGPVEALQRAQPLPSDEDLAIEGLTDEEWAAFEAALAGR